MGVTKKLAPRTVTKTARKGMAKSNFLFFRMAQTSLKSRR